MTTRIKVFHVEDYQIMLDGVRSLLSQDDEIELVGDAKDGEDLLVAMERVEIDVLILDLYLDALEDLDVMNGFQICRKLQDVYPHVKIIAHSVYDDADRVANILKCGALGFVSKRSGFDELLRGIKVVARAERFICQETSSRLKNLNEFLLGMDDNLKGREEVFSLREREVLNLLSQGKSSKVIGTELFITERTVESHRKNMIQKGKVKNTVELIAYAASLGLIKKTG